MLVLGWESRSEATGAWLRLPRASQTAMSIAASASIQYPELMPRPRWES